jgi:adenosylmethionine-8-amino-7-oxononanoate aminotransferase
VRGGLGLWAGVELVAEREPHTWYPPGAGFAAKVSAQALTRDVWVYPSGSGDPVRDAIMVGPPFTITEQEIDVIVAALRDSIDAAAEG